MSVDEKNGGFVSSLEGLNGSANAQINDIADSGEVSTRSIAVALLRATWMLRQLRGEVR